MITAVEKSKNSKTGSVSATYAPIHTCPTDCPFRDSGCYGQGGRCGLHFRKLNAASEGIDLDDLAREEAAGIRGLSGRLPLRIHVVGDCPNDAAAKIVSEAAVDYTAKCGSPAWTYTHAWRDVERSSWGSVSVLASCETVEECREAMDRGYAAALVVEKPFQKPKKVGNVTLIPCLEMTQSVQCTKCKMCFNAEKLLKNRRVICFFAHGAQTKKAQKAIQKKQRKEGRERARRVKALRKALETTRS